MIPDLRGHYMVIYNAVEYFSKIHMLNLAHTCEIWVLMKHNEDPHICLFSQMMGNKTHMLYFYTHTYTSDLTILN